MKVSRETPKADAAAELPASDSGLVGEIRSEIERTGPMSFARFMELALYHPEHGYYATRADRGTRTGDFLTAPETHPIFGQAIARQLDELWRAAGSPREYGVVEYGAGAGTLAIDMFRGLAADGSPLGSSLRYRPVEISRERERSIRDRLDAEGFGDRILDEGGVTVGCAVANEFLDALPVHRVIQVRGELREFSVDWQGGRFVEVATTPTSPDLAARLADEGIELAIGQQAEICLRLDDWAVEVSSQILRGFVLLIDYGYQARELYRPGRGSTLRAYTGNRAHADPFVAIGRQDLTAHVDFTAVERALALFGWRKIGDTSQAEFLMGVGAEEILQSVQADPATTAGEYLALRSALGRMLDPRAMGGFRVLLFARDVGDGFTPRAFSFTLRKATVGT